MLLLVTDTSGRDGFVGLVRASEDAQPANIDVIEEVPLAGGTFSAQLVPQIAALLEKHGFRKTDIAAFIVVSGPGSFTGLRVGLAAIKALAEILEKPIVPVSLLEVAAFASGVQGRVLVALDGGRGEIYAGEYEFKNDTPYLISERLLTKQECFSRSAEASLPIVTRDAALAASANEAGRPVVGLEAIDAAMIARLGWKKLQTGVNVSPNELEANYIRRSDAEIFAKG
jgi:tRNA threonylcarbamoyladenosine biosynthesis protein TsaB